MSKSKSIDLLCEYVKDNPDCVIEYCDNKNFIVYKKYKKAFVKKNGFGWDWEVNDDGPDYIPNIALMFLACAKLSIDISKVKIISA